jgi:dTDP-4-amino-4,6-dideoxygalactose transaminase
MEALCSIAEQHGITIIEDCAHAIESTYHGQRIGTFGDFGCFSFYVTKNIATGEGGMILTSDEGKAARLKILALHGMDCDAWKRFSDEGYRHYLVTEAGFKYNMMDIQAAIGLHQLERVETYWNRRQEVWNLYNKAFKNLAIQTPANPEPDTKHGYHLYTLLVDEQTCGVSRDAFLSLMNQENIGTGVHYLSLPEHPFYKERFGWKPDEYPNAMRIGRQTVSLPLSAKLTDKDVGDVVTAARRIFA